MVNYTYLFSLDNGKTWSNALATGGNETKTVYMGRIKNYKPNKNYSASDVEVYRKFNLDGKAIIPTTTTTPPPPGPITPTPPTNTPPVLFTVDVLNFSNESDSDIKKWCDACKIQADKDISKYWGYTVNINYIPKGGTPVKNHAYMGFFNDSDQAGVLGWHDEGPNHEPLIKIFTKESRRFNLNPSGTVSHEIAESISDPNASTTVKGFDEKGRACLYFYENADPVENDYYQINGVDVSDFVTPTWFVSNANGPYDLLNKVKKPYEIRQGGYMEQSYDNGKTWTQVTKFNKHAAQLHNNDPGSRWNLYKKPRAERKLSTFKVVA